MRVTDEMVERFWSQVPRGANVWKAEMRAALEAALADVPEPPSVDMLASLQAWWEQHALALRMTSRSVHQAIGVAISALERGQPFPMMQVIADVPGKEGTCE